MISCEKPRGAATFRGTFHLSFTVLYAIGHQVVFRLGGWSLRLPTGFQYDPKPGDLSMPRLKWE